MGYIVPALFAKFKTEPGRNAGGGGGDQGVTPPPPPTPLYTTTFCVGLLFFCYV